MKKLLGVAVVAAFILIWLATKIPSPIPVNANPTLQQTNLIERVDTLEKAVEDLSTRVSRLEAVADKPSPTTSTLTEDFTTSAPSDLGGPPLTPGQFTEAAVMRVIDGDTIEVELAGQGGVTYRVRYIGINTPESNEPYGSEATAKNRALVEKQTVMLEKDVSETDRYGRLLRYVWLPGVEDHMVNYELVRTGYAQVATYPPDVKYYAFFMEAQQRAQEAQLGLWGGK